MSENSQAPLSPLAPKEITALKYKIMDFIQENDPFGDRISQYELLCLAQYFADAATARAAFALAALTLQEGGKP